MDIILVAAAVVVPMKALDKNLTTIGGWGMGASKSDIGGCTEGQVTLSLKPQN
jgi:hypothetical protein